MEQQTAMNSLVQAFAQAKIATHIRHLMFTGDLSNHELLGALYEMHDDNFDSLAEKTIAMYGIFDVNFVSEMPSDFSLAAVLVELKLLVLMMQDFFESCDDLGVQNMIQDAIDLYQGFIYKMTRILGV